MRGTYRTLRLIVLHDSQGKGAPMQTDAQIALGIIGVFFYAAGIGLNVLFPIALFYDDLPPIFVPLIVVLVSALCIYMGWYPEIWEPAPLPFSPNAVFSFFVYVSSMLFYWREYELRRFRKYLTKSERELFKLKYGKERPH